VTKGGPKDEEYGQGYEGTSGKDSAINEREENEDQTNHNLSMNEYQHHELYEKLFYK